MSDRFFIFWRGCNKKRLFVSVTYSLLNLHCDKLQKKEKLSSFYDAVIDLYFTAAAYCCRQMKTIHLQMKSFLQAVENIFILKTNAFFLKLSHRLFFYRKIKLNGKHPFSTGRCLASNLSFISKMTRLSVIIIIYYKCWFVVNYLSVCFQKHLFYVQRLLWFSLLRKPPYSTDVLVFLGCFFATEYFFYFYLFFI